MYYDDIINYHIEHHRDLSRMNEELVRNMQLFYGKYKDNNIITYWEFLIGKVTLKEMVQKIQLKEKGDSINIDKIPDEKVRFFTGKFDNVGLLR